MSLEFSSVYWLDLVVDEQVIRYLSSGSFIPYLQYKTAKGNKTLTFSKYGARADARFAQSADDLHAPLAAVAGACGESRCV